MQKNNLKINNIARKNRKAFAAAFVHIILFTAFDARNFDASFVICGFKKFANSALSDEFSIFRSSIVARNISSLRERDGAANSVIHLALQRISIEPWYNYERAVAYLNGNRKSEI